MMETPSLRGVGLNPDSHCPSSPCVRASLSLDGSYSDIPPLHMYVCVFAIGKVFIVLSTCINSVNFQIIILGLNVMVSNLNIKVSNFLETGNFFLSHHLLMGNLSCII